MQNGTESIDLDAYDGFSIESFTSNPSDEENTLSMLINENNYDDGQCSVTMVISYEPQANTGWYGKLYIVNQILGGGGRDFVFGASDATGTINEIQQSVNAGTTYEIEVVIGNRLLADATISFKIDYFQSDSTRYDEAYITGATYSGTLYDVATIYPHAGGNNITITIPIDNDT